MIEKDIRHTGAAAHGLPPTVTPVRKLGSGGKRKITKVTVLL